MPLEFLDKSTDKEIRMGATNHDDQSKYKSPPWAQRWFLERSRENWKNKYMQVKTDTKRLENRVNDVTKSREKWREDAKQLTERVHQLEAEVAALQEQLAASKKDGPVAGA
jgi:peptidoglycan hydrolase CwlO-like protein